MDFTENPSELHPHFSPPFHIFMINRSPLVSPCVRKWRWRGARGLHFKKDSAYPLYWGQERAQAPLKQDILWGSQGTRWDTFHPYLPERRRISLPEHLEEVITEEILLKTQKPAEVWLLLERTGLHPRMLPSIRASHHSHSWALTWERISVTSLLSRIIHLSKKWQECFSNL